MRKIGKALLLVVLFHSETIHGQCIGMEKLVILYELGSFSDQSDYGMMGEVNFIPYVGYNMDIPCQKYYGLSADMVYCLPNDIVLWACAPECYNKIHSTVVKEVGGKVIENGISQENGFSCESYARVGKPYFIQFLKNVSTGTYNVVLLSESRQGYFKIAIDQVKRQLEIDQLADKYLTDIRSAQDAADINSSDRFLAIAKKYFGNNSVSDSKKNELEQLERLCKNTKLSDCKRRVDKELKLNNFERAIDITNSYDTQDIDFSNFIQSIQQKISESAISYYSKRCDESKLKNELRKSLLYADSILLFDQSSSYAKQRRTELLSILAFLDQRKTTEFDFWQDNGPKRNLIIGDLKQLVLSKKVESTGLVHFQVDLTSDTSCALNSKLEWISAPMEGVYFGRNEMYKYDLKAYQRFDYCANSRGNLNLKISWVDQINKEKCYEGGFKSTSNVDSEVQNYLASYYPKATGKVTYKQSLVQVNGNEQKDISIMKFHTRGPWNAAYSFLVPGAGLLITSYGHRGYGPLLLYATGIGAIASGDAQLVSVGALALATSFVWDFSATISLGGRNLRNSRSLRAKLRTAQINL